VKADLERLLKLYKPNVGKGNFMPDVHARGANELLGRVLVTLGLTSARGVEAHFRALDAQAAADSAARLDRINARERAEA
jgi:hypothetical protein